jgi:polar amino acid transport system substrate-binding protein
MKVRVAYLDEPPFYWTGPDGSAMGASAEIDGVLPKAPSKI